MPDGPCLAELNVGNGRALQGFGARSPTPFFKPGLDFTKIPDHASRGEVEALGKFAALFHVIDRCVSEGHDFAEFMPSDRAFRDCSGWLLRHLKILHQFCLNE